MKIKIFWIGAIVLALGVILFVYGYSDIQTIGSAWHYSAHYLRHQIATILEAVGIGLIVMGALITAYSILTKSGKPEGM